MTDAKVLSREEIAEAIQSAGGLHNLPRIFASHELLRERLEKAEFQNEDYRHRLATVRCESEEWQRMYEAEEQDCTMAVNTMKDAVKNLEEVQAAYNKSRDELHTLTRERDALRRVLEKHREELLKDGDAIGWIDAALSEKPQ